MLGAIFEYFWLLIRYILAMEGYDRFLRDIESVLLPDTITAIDWCRDYLGVGCLDDSLHVWSNGTPNFKLESAHLSQTGNSMGIVDLSFNKKSTILATSCMDSTIQIYDLLKKQISSSIECKVMQNWKIQCVEDDIMTAGDFGQYTLYDSISKEQSKKGKMGETFITALAQGTAKNYTAIGNHNGQIHISHRTGNKDLAINFKAHHQIVRDLTFIDQDSKLLSASDDCSIKQIDIASEKIVYSFEGHKLGVSSVSPHLSASHIFFSTSFDKTVRMWDMRTKACVASTLTSSPMWDCKHTGKNLIAGGDTGVLFIYSLE